MPKAYWIAHVDVSDPERYQDYIAAAAPRSSATARSSWRGAGRSSRSRATPARATW